MQRSGRWTIRHSSRTALTLLELIFAAAFVLCGIAATVAWIHRTNAAAAEDYRIGFVRGILFAVREGESGGIMCGEASHEMDGFHDARLFVGRKLSPDLEIGRRVEIAADVIRRSTIRDPELRERTLAALDDYGVERGR